MDEFDKMMWAYKAVFTQAGAGGGAIIVDIIAAERMVFLYGTIGRDNYAADRTVLAYVRDSAGIDIANILFASPIDELRINLFVGNTVSGLVAVAVEQSASLGEKLVIGGGDMLRIQISTPIQNETLTITMRALISSTKPTVSSAGSGGTVTVVTAYDKVI